MDLKIGADGMSGRGTCNVFSLFWRLCIGRIIIAKVTRASLLLQRTLPRKVYVVDWHAVGYRISAWKFAGLTGNASIRCLRKRWEGLHLEGEEVVVMGTGPSAEMVFEEPYRSMPLITCNTSLKSTRLRQHNIVGFCVIDALYFLAPTAYGEAFRASLRTAVMEKEFPIFVDAEHERFLLRRFPWLPAHRLYGVRIDSHYLANSDFKVSPTQKAFNSVFPTMMLPLATTFFKRIHLVGFDGKDKSLKKYFWKHSDEFQFPELIPSVKEHDPAFFSNEEDFYERHHLEYSDMISSVLTLAESKGKEIIMAHRSFIPSLNALFERTGQSAK